MEQRIVWRNFRSLGGRPEFWLIGLLLWILGSAARSWGTPWGSAALTEALRWTAGIGLALALGLSLRRTEMAGRFLVTLTGVMALLGILGSETAAHSGLVGPYRDHQLYGSALLLLLPFSASAALTARQQPWRWGALAALTAGTLCLCLSQTRSAWIGLIPASLLFGTLWFHRSRRRPTSRRIVLIPAVLLLFGLGLVWLLNGSAEQRAAVTSRAATLTALSQDGSWQSRLALWRGTARLIAAHPAFGIGLGRYPGEQWLWTHSGGPLSPTARPSLTEEAHSVYGQTAAETGLIGLALYLAALVVFAAQTVRCLQKRPSHHLRERDVLRIAVLSALAGQAVDGLASPSWQFPEVSLFFWAVLGLGLASGRQEAMQREAVPSAPFPLLPLSLRRAGQWALSGSVAVVLAAQILPVGLLTPVEAYDHLSDNVFKSLAISKTSCTTVSGTCFSLIAVYSDGIHDMTFDDGGLTRTPSSFTCLKSGNTICTSTFGTTTATKNQLTVSSSEIGKSLTITGAFYDGSYPAMPAVSGRGTYAVRSAAITITP